MREIQCKQAEFLTMRPLMAKEDSYHRSALKMKEETDEMLAEMDWGNSEPTPEHIDRVGKELADVVIYAATLANLLGINLSEVTLQKIKHNEKRFPAHLFQDETQNFHEVYMKRKKELGER